MIIVHLITLHVVRVSMKSVCVSGGGVARGVSTGAAAGLKLPLTERGREEECLPVRLTVPTETDLTPFGALSQLV